MQNRTPTLPSPPRSLRARCLCDQLTEVYEQFRAILLLKNIAKYTESWFFIAALFRNCPVQHENEAE